MKRKILIVVLGLVLMGFTYEKDGPDHSVRETWNFSGQEVFDILVSHLESKGVVFKGKVGFSTNYISLYVLKDPMSEEVVSIYMDYDIEIEEECDNLDCLDTGTETETDIQWR